MNCKMIQSIKNTKILKISLVFLFFFVCIGLLFGWRALLNYAIAFFSFMGVFFSLFIPLKNKFKGIQPLNNPSHLKDEKISLLEKISIGMGLSFSFFRISSYVFLSFVLIVLLEYQIFEVYAYFVGIFVALCCVILAFVSRFS